MIIVLSKIILQINCDISCAKIRNIIHKLKDLFA